MSEENFGHVRIDDPEAAGSWDGGIPYLDYWRVRFDKSKLSDEQAAFYKYVKSTLDKGEKIKEFSVNPYLLILRDELVKKAVRVRDRQAAIVTIKKLNTLYGFHDFTLDEILKKEAEAQRERRIRVYKKALPASWIAPSETVTVDGRTLTRGGFYLGKYLKFSKYNLTEKTFFKSSVNIEGPVVNTKGSDVLIDRDLTRDYTTFIEMSDELQQAVLDWLAGDDTGNANVLTYYLAGIEMRLLGDRDTTDDERRTLIRYLVELYYSPSVTTLSKQSDIRRIIISLIDHTVARYLPEESESLLPENLAVSLSLTLRSRIGKMLSCVDETDLNHNEILAIVGQEIKAPKWLPEVFIGSYREHVIEKLKVSLNYRNDWNTMPRHEYIAISSNTGYTPVDEVAKGLKGEPTRISMKVSRIVDKVVTTINYTLSELSSFMKAKRAGAPPMRLARLLPRWCDSTLLGGLSEALSEIKPAEGEKFRVVKLGTLLDTLGAAHEPTLDAKAMGALNLDLYKLGLRVSTSAIRGTKLTPDELVAVYDYRYGDVTTRGSLLISLFLVAWMVGVDGVRERDFRIVDQWLSSLSDKEEQVIPAMASFRWLANRKLTMSVKRKLRASQLIKYPKKRDEFVKILLSIISDAESTSAKRMARLQTIYTLIGLNPDDIHSDLHRLATTSSVVQKKSSSSAAIDKTRLKEMAQSTQEAQKILAEVFVDEQAEEPKTKKQTKKEPKMSAKAEDPTLQILRLLINKSEWTRAEFETLSKSHGETVGSMLERLNDYSYEHVDEAVAEDDDENIYIDTDVAQQLLEI